MFYREREVVILRDFSGKNTCSLLYLQIKLGIASTGYSIDSNSNFTLFIKIRHLFQKTFFKKYFNKFAKKTGELWAQVLQ
jgi:hypothetical protein